MSARVELLPRRLTITSALRHLGRTWLMNVGFDREGAVREVFLDGLPIDGVEEGATDATCIRLSHALQEGESITALAAAMPEGTLYRIALAEAASIERESGAVMRDAWLCAERNHPLQQETKT